MSTVAFFPGQGSQIVGMGKDLYDNFSLARQIFEEASDAVKIDLKKLCFDGPEDTLKLTENTQPCLLVTSVAAYRVAVKEFDFQPTAAAGHSLGEYSALVAADAIPLGEATKWVRTRGQEMQKAVPAGEGSMAAIMGLEDEHVTQLCEAATLEAKTKRGGGFDGPGSKVEPTVQPANYNAPGQVVIAGSTDAIEAAIRLVATDTYPGGKAVPLAVSAPFHSSLMAPARQAMAKVFETSSVKPAAPKFPYVPNCTAKMTSEAGVVFELLVEQVDHPVKWKQSVELLSAQGFSTGVEFGPGRVLQGLVKRIARKTKKPFAVQSVGDTESLKKVSNG